MGCNGIVTLARPGPVEGVSYCLGPVEVVSYSGPGKGGKAVRGDGSPPGPPIKIVSLLVGPLGPDELDGDRGVMVSWGRDIGSYGQEGPSEGPSVGEWLVEEGQWLVEEGQWG